MLDFVFIGFAVLTIWVLLFALLNGIYRERRREAARQVRDEHPHVATAIRDIDEHPRMAKAVRELQDAIAYMESAPHDFGGHKGAAIANARAAIEQLRKAISYRLSR